MSWFSNLSEAYDRVSDIVGIPDNNGNVLLPLNHMEKKTNICVTIDGEGNFRRAEKSEKSIIIPCTEDSSTRTGAIPHPLHDDLGYLAMDEKKHQMYLSQLSAWKKCHHKAAAVYEYIIKGTLPDDLKLWEIDIDIKSFVRFCVEIPGDMMVNIWEDASVAHAWQEYCMAVSGEEKTLCYVTGAIEPYVMKHPKGINLSANSAKLISCNDETNYTYRGRFMKPQQANAISANASHKAHSLLKYLIATQGYKCDTQAIVAWAIDDADALPDPFAGSDDLYGIFQLNDNEKVMEAQGMLQTDYAKKLGLALRGKGNAENLTNSSSRIAVMSTDAATTGRMGITFYQDMLKNEYIERVIAWHESCCWWFFKNECEYVSAPGADKIIIAVYGEPKGEGYKKIQKQARERLLRNIVCGEPLDRGWINAAVTRTSNPFSFNKKDGGWDKWKWEHAINVTCSIVRKYFYKEEELSLELEKSCTNRDYLFGRLIAVADRLESHARYLQTGKDDTDKRPTNAVRYMSAFASKPLRTWRLLYDQLNPYIQRLNGAEWYQREIDEIMSLFCSDDDFSDKPLGGKYLLGYSLQRRAMKQKNTTQEESIHELIQED